MPAHFLREVGLKIGQTFGHFTDAAERLGIYTALDYVDILKELIEDWHIESATGLEETAKKPVITS
jgi:acyl-[acyl-carrier-protein] desaturase